MVKKIMTQSLLRILAVSFLIGIAVALTVYRVHIVSIWGDAEFSSKIIVMNLIPFKNMLMEMTGEYAGHYFRVRILMKVILGICLNTLIYIYFRRIENHTKIESLKDTLISLTVFIIILELLNTIVNYRVLYNIDNYLYFYLPLIILVLIKFVRKVKA